MRRWCVRFPSTKEIDTEVSVADAKAFGASVGAWPTFSDSSEALRRLSELGLKLVILSNVDNISFEG